MKFIYDDGGRAAAGYKGSAGDCVARAIAIASGKPYAEVYSVLAKGTGMQRAGKCGKRSASARDGINTTRQCFKDYMKSLGFVWTPTMTVGSGCKVHLTDDELPMGRLVVSLSKHYTTVIDGVIHDTYNPERNVHEMRVFPGWQDYELKAGETRNHNGVFTVRRRCVYGYWRMA